MDLLIQGVPTLFSSSCRQLTSIFIISLHWSYKDPATCWWRVGITTQSWIPRKVSPRSEAPVQDLWPSQHHHCSFLSIPPSNSRPRLAEDASTFIHPMGFTTAEQPLNAALPSEGGFRACPWAAGANGMDYSVPSCLWVKTSILWSVKEKLEKGQNRACFLLWGIPASPPPNLRLSCPVDFKPSHLHLSSQIQENCNLR